VRTPSRGAILSLVAHTHSQVQASIGREADRGRLAVALALMLGLMAAEVAVGLLAGSLAVLSDAAHMLSDAGALALALLAIHLARRPPGGRFTFGLRRAEILSSQVNGFTLLVLAGLIVYGGIRRLASPPEVDGGPVLIVALAGAATALAATLVLAGSDRRSLNVEGAFQHILTDLFAFAATAAAGAVILATGFTQADGIAALVVAALMLRAAYGLLRESGRVLLEGAPRGVDPAEVGRALASHPHVVEIHDLHLWEVTSGFPSLSAHVLVGAHCDCHEHRRELEGLLRDRFGIEHTTLQVEHSHEDQEPLAIQPLRRNG
jgi:cobalt-zinc-cadmium efflux system protein